MANTSSNISNQVLYSGIGPLDTKSNPVNTLNDLYLIPRSMRYEGQTIYVKSEKIDYWLVGGTLNMNWIKKIDSIPISGDDI